MKRILVVGLGKLGRAIAQSLTASGVDVIAVDQSMELVEDARDHVSAAVQADATDLDSLIAAGARGVTAAVVAIGEDFEASVLATSVLRELGIPQIVARANSSREERILRLIGATEIVFIEQEVGQRLAQRLAGKAGGGG